MRNFLSNVLKKVDSVRKKKNTTTTVAPPKLDKIFYFFRQRKPIKTYSNRFGFTTTLIGIDNQRICIPLFFFTRVTSYNTKLVRGDVIYLFRLNFYRRVSKIEVRTRSHPRSTLGLLQKKTPKEFRTSLRVQSLNAD